MIQKQSPDNLQKAATNFSFLSQGRTFRYGCVPVRFIVFTPVPGTKRPLATSDFYPGAILPV